MLELRGIRVPFCAPGGVSAGEAAPYCRDFRCPDRGVTVAWKDCLEDIVGGEEGSGIRDSDRACFRVD